MAIGGGRRVARGDDVFDAQRNALQRTLVDAPLEICVGLLRRCQRGFTRDRDERAEARVKVLDPAEHARRQLDAGSLAVAQSGGRGFDGQRQVRHRSSVRSASKIKAGSS